MNLNALTRLAPSPFPAAFHTGKPIEFWDYIVRLKHLRPTSCSAMIGASFGLSRTNISAWKMQNPILARIPSSTRDQEWGRAEVQTC